MRRLLHPGGAGGPETRVAGASLTSPAVGATRRRLELSASAKENKEATGNSRGGAGTGSEPAPRNHGKRRAYVVQLHQRSGARRQADPKEPVWNCVWSVRSSITFCLVNIPNATMGTGSE
ncbi:hypothetical protein E2320_015279 [Naja naja]|nr:hypothetical protein E2320_015279 [Naja naja]